MFYYQFQFYAYQSIALLMIHLWSNVQETAEKFSAQPISPSQKNSDDWPFGHTLVNGMNQDLFSMDHP